MNSTKLSTFFLSLVLLNTLSLTAMHVEVPDPQTEKQIEMHHRRTMDSVDRLDKKVAEILELKHRPRIEKMNRFFRRENTGLIGIAAGVFGLTCLWLPPISRSKVSMPAAQLSAFVAAGCLVKMIILDK